MEKNARTGPGADPANEVQALAEAVLEAARVAGIGVLVSFDDGVAPRYTYVNAAAAEIFGRSIEELTGGATAVTFSARDRERVQDASARARRGEAPPNVTEALVVRHGGEQIPVEIAFSVVPLAGDPASVMFVRDIRERKLAEAALRRSEQRFRQLIEAAPDAIGVSEGCRLVYVNPALTALSGRPFDELVARDVTDFVHPGDRALLGARRQVGAEGDRGALEYRLVRPDGQVVNVETVSIPIEYEGRPAVLGFTRETTERTLLQAHLALRDRMAMLGMLAASVAHEINNPLAYATLNFELILRQLSGCMPDNVCAAVEPMIAAAREGLAQVATIVRDLQKLTTPDSAECWPVDVQEVLESALKVAAHAIRRRARIERAYADVESLKTDPTKLGQILLNLVFNAVQSFDPSRAEENVISLGLSSTSQGDVLISVADNGPGIAKEHLDRIFEPFFTSNNHSVGLGLAICQVLATSLGGELTAESEKGKGTRFTLMLPGPSKLTATSSEIRSAAEPEHEG